MRQELPLFVHERLARLKERRDALLKRVQRMPAHAADRPLVFHKLQQVTADVIRLETELDRRRP